MRRSRWSRGGLIALILASSTLLLSGCSFSDASKDLRFGWPTGITKQAERMRALWSWSCVAALVLGCIVWALIFWCCIRYRKRTEDLPRQTKYNLVIEVICVAVPLVVIVVLFWRTVVVEDYVNKLTKNPDVVVEVDAFKWNWQFQYQDVQGKPTDYRGQTDRTTGEKNSPLYVNTIGSDTEIPILVIPVNESVQVVEHSEDVVHSFWVPEFLFKRDVIPYGTPAQQKASGLTDNRFEFTATTKGSYVGRCAELCGTYHSQMNFEVRVVEPGVFQKYLSELQKIGPDDPGRQWKALTAAHVPGGPYATTTHPFDLNRGSTPNAGTGGGS